jgi:hypothetical protein
MNYLLLSNKKRKHDALHFVGKSVLNGLFIYEILLDKIDKNKALTKQFNVRDRKIIIDPYTCMMHVSVLQMKNTIDIYDPYNYKNKNTN